MFIHLGEDVVIRSSDVVTILDRQLLTTSEVTNEFIDRYKKDGLVVDISGDTAKSIVVTTDTVYLSPLSSITLKRRAQMTAEFEPLEEVEN
jgi:extracellular matrix regulatory protein B